MFKALLTVSFLFLSSAMCATASATPAHSVYKIDMNLVLNGKHVSSPKMYVISGEKAEIQNVTESGHGHFIEVTPSEMAEEPGKVHLKFTVGLIVKRARQILSNPEMIVSEGQTGTIAVGEGDDPENFTLTVLVNRQVSKK